MNTTNLVKLAYTKGTLFYNVKGTINENSEMRKWLLSIGTVNAVREILFASLYNLLQTNEFIDFFKNDELFEISISLKLTKGLNTELVRLPTIYLNSDEVLKAMNEFDFKNDIETFKKFLYFNIWDTNAYTYLSPNLCDICSKDNGDLLDLSKTCEDCPKFVTVDDLVSKVIGGKIIEWEISSFKMYIERVVEEPTIWDDDYPWT